MVRDRIPEIITAGGGSCETETLPEEAYLTMLEKKLQEELTEYLQSGEIEELADLLEVMQAVAAAKGVDWQAVEAAQKAKRSARGGFENRVLLKSVTK